MLGEINITVHQIELILETRPIAQAPYRAGPRGREIVDAEVQKIFEAGVIEPARSEWVSPVLLVAPAGLLNAILRGLPKIERSNGEGHVPFDTHG